MAQLFVSYSYTARQGEQFFQGFGHMVNDSLPCDEPSDEEHIEVLQGAAEQHCRETLGMDLATATILWWRLLEP